MGDINEMLCELLGIKYYLNRVEKPDFFSPAGRIDLLKRIRDMKELDNFFLFYGEMQREEFGELPMVGLEFTSIFIDSIMLDDNGALARVALEFLEANHA